MTDEGSRTTHEATALHEAGHAVAHVRLLDALGNALISHISIVPNPDANTLGHMSAEDDPCDASVAAATVTVLCAGYAALVAAGYEDKEARDGAWSDFERAQELIDAWKLDPLEACMGKAVMLMLEDRNINAVRTVASEVLVKRRLDGDYIHALIELSDGEITRDDLANFLYLSATPEERSIFEHEGIVVQDVTYRIQPAAGK